MYELILNFHGRSQGKHYHFKTVGEMIRDTKHHIHTYMYGDDESLEMMALIFTDNEYKQYIETPESVEKYIRNLEQAYSMKV